MKTEQLQLVVGERTGAVSAIYIEPPHAHTLFVLAHGAGANMRHAFMETIAARLAEAGVATLRYNFPYMEAGGKAPNPPAVLEATVRAAVEQGSALAGGRRLIAGGKSMGGRMTSQYMAKHHDARVRGVAFLGFPLHQPGKPGMARAEHLADVQVPMLFLQGTRDTLANLEMMREVTDSLGARATLHVIDTADHSFAVLKRSGLTSEQVFAELATTIAAWAERTSE